MNQGFTKHAVLKITVMISFLVISGPELLAQCSFWTTTITPKCVNGPLVTLTGGTPGPGIYMGTGVVGSTFNPSVAGVGSHKIGYKANSCTDTAFKTIVVNAVTTPTLTGIDTAYCIDAVPQTIVPVKSPSGGTLTGPGVTGGNFNIGLAGTGNHTVKYFFTNANGCTDTAYSQVHVRTLPTVTLAIPGTQKFVCEFDGPFTITGASPNPGWPDSWFIGTGIDSLLGTFDPDPNIVGWNVVTYHYYDGMCENTAVDSIEVRENPTVSVSAYPLTCLNEPAFILNQGSGLPTGGTETYTGNGVGAGPPYFFNASAAGIGTHQITYCYTATTGCSTCVTQNITVVGTPSVTFNQIKPLGLCENDGPIDLSNPWKGSPSGGYYSGPGIQIDSLTLKPTQMGGVGSYTLTYTYIDSNGCEGSASRTETVNAKPVITITSISPLPTPNPPTDPANITIKICQGDTAFTSIASVPNFPSPPFPIINPTGNQYYTKVSGTVQFHPPSDTDFEIIITANNGCTDTGSVFIDVIPPALAVITGDTNICIGDTTELTASGATSYEWLFPVATTPSVIVSPKASTLYQVVAESDIDGDGNQCSSDTGETIVVVNPLPIITSGNDTLVFYGDQVMLRAYGGVTYTWQEEISGELSCLDCNNPTAFPIYQKGGSEKRWYYVTGTDGLCSNGDSMYIYLNPKIVVFIPNAFTPNEDGFNDKLKVETKGIASIEFEIFDRFGHTVFETSDLNESWDGKYKGELVNKDVYIYRLKAYPYEKVVKPIEQAGEITIIR